MAVGAAVGWRVVGVLLGSADGTDDAVALGALLGELLSVVLGSADGTDDGCTVGALLGT